jgi:hypothetical protein
MCDDQHILVNNNVCVWLCRHVTLQLAAVLKHAVDQCFLQSTGRAGRQLGPVLQDQTQSAAVQCSIGYGRHQINFEPQAVAASYTTSCATEMHVVLLSSTTMMLTWLWLRLGLERHQCVSAVLQPSCLPLNDLDDSLGGRQLYFGGFYATSVNARLQVPLSWIDFQRLDVLELRDNPK